MENNKLVSWNVNGLRACVHKGFSNYFNEIDADIFCVQEIKLQAGQIKLDLAGYHQFQNYVEGKDVHFHYITIRRRKFNSYQFLPKPIHIFIYS